MSKHTSGPWHASQYLDDDRWGVISSDNQVIVRIPLQGVGLRKEDATLIASAPDLLAAAEAAVYCLSPLVSEESLAGQWKPVDKLYRQLTTAIAQAKGER